MWQSHCDRDSGLFPRWKQDFDHVSHALTLGSANNGTRTRHRIPLVKHLHQILFGVEFRISGVGIWALVGTNLRQWVWLYQYSQERWQTYMRAYSPQRSLNSLWYLSLYGRLEFFCVVYPIIKFFFIFGIMVNDAVINPSQINAYVHIQYLIHTNTCIIPENPITAWGSWSDYQTRLTLHNHPARVSMLFAMCFHHAMRFTGHSPDTGTLTEDIFLVFLKNWLLQELESWNPPYKSRL